MVCWGAYKTCCVTQTSHVTLGDLMLLCTASSDGHLAIWDMSQTLSSIGVTIHGGQLCLSAPPHESQLEMISWQQRHSIHQSSVKCMTVISVNHRSALIACGGDDNAISITYICLGKEGGLPKPSHILRIPKVHACAVTAITQLACTGSARDCGQEAEGSRHYRIATSSNDQRLKVWSVVIAPDETSPNAINVRREANEPSSVADVSSMEVMNHISGQTRLILCGVGIEVWKIRSTVDSDREPALSITK